MSASETNIDKQIKRHRGPLFGIAISLLCAGLLFVGFMFWTAYKSDNPTAESPASYLSND